MSSDVPGGGGDRPGRRARIGNFVKRFRTVFRRKKRSTSDNAQLGESSTTATNAPADSTPATATTLAALGATAAPKDEASPSPQPAQLAAGGVPSIDVDPTGEEPKIAFPQTRNVAQQDRVRQLFTKSKQLRQSVDPEILRAVEAKLAQFNLGGSLSSHAAVAVTVS
ncbi:MAG: hypothetical protein Q9165_001007 [Trypethelium subeluteriae]